MKKPLFLKYHVYTVAFKTSKLDEVIEMVSEDSKEHALQALENFEGSEYQEAYGDIEKVSVLIDINERPFKVCDNIEEAISFINDTKIK